MTTTSTSAVRAHLGIRFAELADPGNGFSRCVAYNGKPEFTELAEVPIFPQLPSRMEYFMGEKNRQNPQDINAFYLNVWTLQDGRFLGRGRPVLVFIHGGAWSSGGSSVAWYRGEQLAADGAVVVNLNYRLGPYGHFDVDSEVLGNRPLEDLLHGLQWIRRNIADYGGDPSKVTVMGQSAGAWYALALSCWAKAQGLFSQVTLLSLPKIVPWTAQEKAHYSQRFLAQLSQADAQLTDTEAVLKAGISVIAEIPTQQDELPSMYLPTIDERSDGQLAQAVISPSAMAQQAHIKRALIRYTADEMSVFVALAHQPSASGWDSAQQRIIQRGTSSQFGAPAGELSKAFREIGIDCSLVLFEWETTFSHLGAGHCVDLPFQFGNPNDWDDAPMVKDVSPEKFSVVSARSRQEIIEFTLNNPGLT